MPTVWLLQVCKSNGSLKINKRRRICFVMKWKHFKTNSTTEIRKPVKLFEFLANSNRYTTFPNFFIALGIYINIAVSVACEERSFSKLKLIAYLRSSIQQEPLNSLTIMSIESKVSRGLNLDIILKDFANVKARNISFS